MNVLITGGSGFVCLNIVQKLLEEGMGAVVYDPEPLPSSALAQFDGLPGRLKIIAGSVLDQDGLEKAIQSCGITHIIHGAAVTPTDSQEALSPARVMEINFMGTIRVLECVRKHPRIPLLYISSTGACGNVLSERESIPEDELVFAPESSYGIAKYASEQMVRRYAGLYQLTAATIRLGAVFGPWERPTAARSCMSPALRILQASRQYPEVTFSRHSGEEWIYSREIAEYVWELLHCESFLYPSYCLVSGFSWNTQTWCRLIREKNPSFSYRLAKEGEEPVIRFSRPADFARITDPRLFRQISRVPVYDEETAFKDYMDWLDRHPDFLI